MARNSPGATVKEISVTALGASGAYLKLTPCIETAPSIRPGSTALSGCSGAAFMIGTSRSKSGTHAPSGPKENVIPAIAAVKAPAAARNPMKTQSLSWSRSTSPP